jgi:hypothetical protein
MLTLDEKINIVKSDLLSRFPDCSYTVQILLWDDNTDSVECRYCDNNLKLHTSRYYNNELTYHTTDISDNTYSVVDENGQNKLMYLVDKI